MIAFSLYFKIKFSGLTGGLDIRCERKREIKDDLKDFDLSSWMH